MSIRSLRSKTLGIASVSLLAVVVTLATVGLTLSRPAPSKLPATKKVAASLNRKLPIVEGKCDCGKPPSAPPLTLTASPAMLPAVGMPTPTLAAFLPFQEPSQEKPKVADQEKLKPIGQSAVPVLANSCTFDLTFQKLDNAAAATHVRVRPYSGGANIVTATAPANWLISPSSTGTWFKPTVGGIIPTGSHSGFSITIASNNTGGQYVVVEWLNANAQVICGQLIAVPCTMIRARIGGAVLAPAAPPPYPGPTCGCLNAYTGGDEGLDLTDASVEEVNITGIVSAGFNKFKVSYQLELDPITMPITRVWEVTSFDELGNSAVVAATLDSDVYNPTTGLGTAFFTVPEGGDFEVNLVVNSALACLRSNEAERDDSSEEDTGEYRSTQSNTEIELKPSDPCNPKVYKFSDISQVPGTMPIWTVNGTAITAAQAASYTFPTLGTTYTVCLTTTDPDGTQRQPACQTVTPAASTPTGNFTFRYDACAYSNFVVSFTNDSDNLQCPITWAWTFGDGGTSNLQSPNHTYATAGSYTVTLKANGTQVAQKIVVVEHWEPVMSVTDCGDGSVIWSTNEGATNRDREWLPADGEYASMRYKRRRKKLRVCYGTTGPHTMVLWARNTNGGECTGKKTINITSIVRCCRRDKDKSSVEFTAGGKTYRMTYKARYRGHPGRIFIKTKLQRKLPSGIWVRKKADTIVASISGDVFSKIGDCFCGSGHHLTPTSRTKTNHAKASRWFNPGWGTFRVKQGGLKSIHTVTIAGHTETQTLSLWSHDCECGWRN